MNLLTFQRPSGKFEIIHDSENIMCVLFCLLKIISQKVKAALPKSLEFYRIQIVNNILNIW